MNRESACLTLKFDYYNKSYSARVKSFGAKKKIYAQWRKFHYFHYVQKILKSMYPNFLTKLNWLKLISISNIKSYTKFLWSDTTEHGIIMLLFLRNRQKMYNKQQPYQIWLKSDLINWINSDYKIKKYWNIDL